MLFKILAGALFTQVCWYGSVSYFGGVDRTLCTSSSATCSQPACDASALQPLWRCMRFIDDNCSWDIDTSNFFTDEDRDNDVHVEPNIQLMRLNSVYKVDGEEDAPILRVVAYLPSSKSFDVCRQLTDLELRPQWDVNYLTFEKIPCTKEQLQPLLHMEKVVRPFHDNVHGTDKSQADRTHKIQPLECTTCDEGWYAHRVGSNFFSKLHILPRLFCYERVVRKYCLCTDQYKSNDEECAYEILFEGSRQRQQLMKRNSKSFREWFEHVLAAQQSQLVGVNYQDIILLPIADYKMQLESEQQALWKLMKSGSMTNTADTQLIYDFIKQSSILRAENRKPASSGTLLIMTSSIDSAAPRAMPIWLQKKITSVVGQRALLQLWAKTSNAQKSINEINSQ